MNAKSTLESKIDTEEFGATNKESLKRFNQMQNSDIYGGSIYDSVKIFQTSGKTRGIGKENTLSTDFESLEINYLYGGGFYVLRQVVNDFDFAEDEFEHKYCDIYMLIDSSEDVEGLLALKAQNDVVQIEKDRIATQS